MCKVTQFLITNFFVEVLWYQDSMTLEATMVHGVHVLHPAPKTYGKNQEKKREKSYCSGQ